MEHTCNRFNYRHPARRSIIEEDIVMNVSCGNLTSSGREAIVGSINDQKREYS